MSVKPEIKRTLANSGNLIRQAVERDAAAIARIYNHHVDLGGATFDISHWPTERVESLVRCERPEVWLVAEDQGKVVGWASALQYSKRHGYRYTLESAIYVDPIMIGKGLGGALQRNLQSHCQKNGIHHLVAKISAENERSLAFHRRHGYELVGVQQEIGHMHGAWKDVAILQKRFADHMTPPTAGRDETRSV